MWAYVSRDGTCSRCLKVFSTTNGTSAIGRHLVNAHQIHPPPKTPCEANERNEALIAAMLIACASHGVSFSAMCGPAMRAVAQAAAAATRWPKPEDLAARARNPLEQVPRVVRELVSVSPLISLAYDGASRSGSKFTAVMASAITPATGVPVRRCLFVVNDPTHDADLMARHLRQAREEIEAAGGVVVAATSDGAAEMPLAASREGLEWVHCGLHLFALPMKALPMMPCHAVLRYFQLRADTFPLCCVMIPYCTMSS